MHDATEQNQGENFYKLEPGASDRCFMAAQFSLHQRQNFHQGSYFNSNASDWIPGYRVSLPQNGNTKVVL